MDMWRAYLKTVASSLSPTALRKLVDVKLREAQAAVLAAEGKEGLVPPAGPASCYS